MINLKDYKWVVSESIKKAQRMTMAGDALRCVLTLNNRLEITSAMETLTDKEKNILRFLDHSFSCYSDEVTLYAYYRFNRLQISDTRIDESDLCRFVISFQVPRNIWTKYQEKDANEFSAEITRCMKLISSSTIDLRQKIARIGYYLNHMAPVIYYVGDHVYSNFDYLNNLTSNRINFKKNNLFEYWDSEDYRSWDKEDLIFICFLDYLLESGIQTRCEEFNAKQISLKILEKYFDIKHDEYLSEGIVISDYNYESSLESKAQSLKKEFALACDGRTVYRYINGLSLQKEERYLDDESLRAELPEYSSINQMLKNSFNLDFYFEYEYENSLMKYYSANGKDCESAFLSLLKAILKCVSNDTKSDLAFSRFFCDIGLLIRLTKEQKYQEICDLNPRHYYCYVLPGDNMVRKMPSVITANVAMAATTRMLYNGWHYMPANFLSSQSVDNSKREYYFSAVLPDVAKLDKYHHVGHVKSEVNNTIRIPGELWINGREFKSLMDLRLMRQGDEEYTISDLKKALKAFKYVQIAEQKLIDYISDLNNYDFSLTQMTKKTYINLIQLMKKEN